MKNKIIKTIMLVSSFILLTACNSNNCCSNGNGTNPSGNDKGLRSEYSFDEKYFAWTNNGDLSFNFNYHVDLRIERKIGIPNTFDGIEVKNFTSWLTNMVTNPRTSCPFTDIYVDEGIETVYIYDYNNYIHLENIILPSTISGVCFADCSNLLSVSVLSAPNNLERIMASAFENCGKLSSIFSIPESVTSIGKYAFYQCYELKELFYDGTTEQWNQIKFESNWRSSSLERINCSDGTIYL